MEESSLKYGAYCRTIAWNILFSREDSEECVNDTMLKAWQSIPPKKPLHFRAYLAKVARNLALNRYEAEHSQMRGGGAVPAALDELAECIPSPDNTEQVLDQIALSAALDSFLKTLPDQHAKVFMRRYFSMLEVGAVADELQPIRDEFKRLAGEKAYLDGLFARGAETAERISQRTLIKVKKKVGLILP